MRFSHPILVLFLLVFVSAGCQRSNGEKSSGKVVAKIEKPLVSDKAKDAKKVEPESRQQDVAKTEPTQAKKEGWPKVKPLANVETNVTEEKQDKTSEPEESAAEDAVADEQITLKDVQRKTKEAIITIEAYVASKEREYHQKIDAQFNRFDQRLTRLRESARKLSEEAKKRVSHEVRELQANLENTQQNLLGKLEVSNEDDVKQLEQNLNQMVAQMEQSLAKVKP